VSSWPIPTPEPLVDVDRARAALAEAGLDALVAHSLQNLFYLSGLQPLDYLVEAGAIDFAVLPARPDDPAQVTVPAFGRYMLDDYPLWPPGKVVFGGFHIAGGPPSASVAGDPIEALAVACRAAGVPTGRVGFELEQLPVAVAARVRAALPELDLVDASGVLRDLRRRKTSVELERIRVAGRSLVEAIDEAAGSVRVDTSEHEIERRLREALLARSLEVTSVSLGTGPRGALVWSYPTERRVQAGEVIRFDITCSYGGYHADLARTVAVAEASELDRARYRAIRASLEAAIGAVRAGGTCAEVFAAGMRPPREAGLADFDRHNFGHGIGLDVHEAPGLADTDDEIPVGAALCVESPYYVYGVGAFMAEDMVIVHDDHVERLTVAPTELPVVG